MSAKTDLYLTLQSVGYQTPRVCADIVNQFSSLAHFYEETSRLNGSYMNAQIESLVRRCRQFSVEKAKEAYKKKQIEIIFIDSDDYPSQLKEISDPPLCLFIKGNKALLKEPQIGVVGPRLASTYAEKVTSYFTKELLSFFVITSGLAKGVDTIAHQTCISAQTPTIAVVGTGLDIVYPLENSELANTIALGGCIVSEFPLKTPPAKSNFPQRNRIISGLSKGVLICEASQKSGALITAQFALEQNREVFAVPGDIFSPAISGVHRLINDGAKCVSTAQDIFDEFQFSKKRIKQPRLFDSLYVTKNQPDSVKKEENTTVKPPIDLKDNERVIYQLLSSEPKQIDELISQANQSIQTILPTLSLLEIKGYIKELPGKQYQRCP